MNDQKKLQQSVERENKRERQRQILLSRLSARDLRDIQTRVAFVLHHYPETRDSDITLAIRYWSIFDHDKVTDLNHLRPADLYHLERIPSLVRARAKIQNEYGLFLPSEKIRRYRKSREDQERESQLANRPPAPIIEVFADEGAKNDRFFGVGGVWIPSVHRSAQVNIELTQWRRKAYHGKEFHFTDLTRHNVDLAKEFFEKALSLADIWGFRALLVQRSSVRSSDDLTADMYAFYVIRGIRYEVCKGRVSLPRRVNVWKDKEDGVDPILLEKIRNYVPSVLKTAFDDKVELATVEPVDSKSSSLIQVSDLFLGSILRILNRRLNAARNHKDEFAEFVCSALGLQIQNIEQIEIESDPLCIWFLD